jgi:glucose-1-phosphate adenylyltransferase
MPNPKKVIAVIMGGGRGTRLQPLTSERSKPAVPLAGKYRLVDIPISNCINSDINRIFLLTQFQTASLHRHIQSTYNFDSFGCGFVDILSAEQTEKSADWYQGTADAVRRNLQHFRSSSHDYVLILSGDQLYRMDFRDILRQHVESGADATVAAVAFPVAKVEGLGLMRVEDDLSIKEFVEKPKDPAIINSLRVSENLEKRYSLPEGGHCLASMGIYVFNRAALAEALDNTMTDFGKEVIPGLLGKKRLYSYVFQGYWEDIGTVRAFFEANLALAQPLPPFNFFDPVDPIYTQDRYLPPSKINNCTVDYAVLGDGAIVEGSVLRHSVIGIRSFIRSGSHIEDVVMMGADTYESPAELKANIEKGIPHIGVGHNCRITGAIIDKNARIGDNVTLSVAGKADGNYPHGVIVRDGVLLVPKSGIIPSGATV